MRDLPNPFLSEFAESAPANNPAASKRLDKPVDAAGSSTPLGGTATAPGMARCLSDFSMARVLAGIAAALDAELLDINGRIVLDRLSSEFPFSKA